MEWLAEQGKSVCPAVAALAALSLAGYRGAGRDKRTNRGWDRGFEPLFLRQPICLSSEFKACR
jgi:hypothetical protein